VDQGLDALRWANRRVAQLEQYGDRVGAYTEPNYQWNFRIAPSCPPSTTIHMRGGRVWGDWGAGWSGQSWYVDSASYDLADISDSGDAYWFTNPYYYLPFSVMLYLSGYPGATPPLYVINGGTEYATGAEAEAAVYPLISAVPSAFGPHAGYGIPLAILIMRNNGNTTLVNQYMPVDRVNRGRSYIWRNVKVRFQW
jgi:hypothetical protein